MAVADGSEPAVCAVWDRYAPVVRSTLYGYLGPDELVDDLTQEVFLSFVQHARSLREPSALRSYLIGAAVRRATQERRSRGRRRRWLELFGRLWSGAVSAPVVEERDAVRTLARLLDALPERARSAFVLVDVQELPLAEAAAVAEVSLATFKRDLALARERLVEAARQDPALSEYLGRPEKTEAP